MLTIFRYLAGDEQNENMNESENMNVMPDFFTKNPKLEKLRLNSRIRGLAIRFQRLYVTLQTIKSSTIRLFDLKSLKAQNTIVLDLEMSKTLWDLLVLENEKIFLSDQNKETFWELNAQSTTVWRAHPVTSKSSTLSETCEGNVIVSCPSSKQLFEFSPKLDKYYTPISLESLDITPSHAVKLSTGEFVVSDVTGTEHRIVKLNSNGDVICDYGRVTKVENGTLSLNMPTYLVRSKNDFILVADQDNDRILLMSPNLELVRELILPKHGLQKPFRMCLDEEHERLFVHENSQTEISIFSFTD